MKKKSFCFLPLFCICFTFAAMSCSFPFKEKLTFGETKVYLSNNEIIIDNFLGPAYGIAGWGSESWGDFSFDKVDEFIYKQAKKSNHDYFWVVLCYYSEDQYGNITPDERITIGKIDIKETKKYVDYSKWHLYNKTYEMWAKDRYEYENRITNMRATQGISAMIVPAYRPKSIR